jgi:hypothetical protein
MPGQPSLFRPCIRRKLDTRPSIPTPQSERIRVIIVVYQAMEFAFNRPLG